MPCELSVRFDDPAHVVIALNEDGRIQSAPVQPFIGPLDQEAQRDLQWYLEVYPVQYTTEIDDKRAAEIGQRIQGWGRDLFNAAFADREAERLFNRFQDREAEGRLITVASGHPAVLAQPWELLCDPKGTFLFLDRPRISVRRQLAGTGGGRAPFRVTPKEQLHLLFVVSRPKDAGFIDPRADPQAVMDAIEAEAPGRVTYEFLRPATIAHLIRRLDDRRMPHIDVLHFDGHGSYDPDGRLAERARQAVQASPAGHLLRDAPAAEAQQGYLWFENEDGSGAPVAAKMLGEQLNRRQVGLIVLSACQSAMVGGEDPMGSVAARLIDAGLPSVLAMTHSVLVDTTRALFGHFYRELARGEAIGAALDNARAQLYAEPKRGERQRAGRRITLTLQDWFLPALYQAGADAGLLTQTAPSVSAPAARSNVRPLQESGFHGRRRELWDIERWFVGGTRRVVVNGFGGQGKTSLAEEAGRWLPRTGMFSGACFVGYAAFQGSDPVGLAVSTLGTVLGQSLLDADAATDALVRMPTLVILDNLEALDAKALDELLSAAAVWSDAGTSRVLITTRANDLRHASFPTKDSNRCRYLALQGLAADDALDWFQALMRLPPEPQVLRLPEQEPLKNLFAKVSFHPLSVGMLARQLKFRGIAELGERLEVFLQTEHGDPLLASLNLSLDRLDPQSTQWLPRLGVFHGGALEKILTDICELDGAQWLPLRHGLEQSGLIEAESLPGVASPFLRFHPTLAPALWVKLLAGEQKRFAAGHREYYEKLSAVLYHGDTKAVAATRAIARRELPNLLAAVHGALNASSPHAVGFAQNVAVILGWFSLWRDRLALSQRAQAAAWDVGSIDWSRAQSNRGDGLYDAGRFHEAEVVFAAILGQLGDAPSHARCWTLVRLARCYDAMAQSTRAEAICRQGLAEAEQLEQTEEIRRLIGNLQADLGDTLRHLGRYPDARAAHEAAMAISKEMGDDRGVAVSLAQLGTIALMEGNVADAESRYRQALDVFRGLGEPSTVATAWNQLGLAYLRANDIAQAEQAFRESARIKEEIGDRLGACRSWDQLGQVMERAGKPHEAEAWYIKALTIRQTDEDRAGESITRNNLARLLAGRPGRLTDAKAHAERVLAIAETQDPAAMEIWKTYGILALIAHKQGDADAARDWRRRERTSYAAAPVSGHDLRRYAPLIAAVVRAATDPSARPELEQVLATMVERGWTSLVDALRRIILDGERDEDALCAALGREVLIVSSVLRGIADPATLREIAPDGEAMSPARDS